MSKTIVEKDKFVLFSYSISEVKSNTVLEKSELPMGFVFGGTLKMLEKVEQAITGLSIGDEIEVTLLPEDAFGEVDPAMIFREKRDKVPVEFLAVGKDVEFRNDQGETKLFTVTKVDKKFVTFDGNSPMAGKTIRYHVKIHDIREPNSHEMGMMPNPSNSETVH
jgi:FKBP-type peptidyl-prolyl cis-trans isomerase SlyD